MMEMERRIEAGRMDIQKSITLSIPGKKKLYSGITANMSDAGLCAEFSKLPKIGDDVMLHVYWEEDAPPIEQPAEVIWSSSSNTNGKYQVGLRVRDDDNDKIKNRTKVEVDVSCLKDYSNETASKTTEKTSIALQTQSATQMRSAIELGAEVQLMVGGVLLDTKVASVGEINRDNTVQVVLEIVDSAFSNNTGCLKSGEIPPEEQDWTPHPFRDAWIATTTFLAPAILIFKKHALPPIILLASVALRFLTKTKNRLAKKTHN